MGVSDTTIAATVTLYNLDLSDDTSPYANVRLPATVVDLTYEISLSLEVPAMERNYALGNFMVTLDLLSSNNETIAQARRPVGYLFLNFQSLPECTIS